MPKEKAMNIKIKINHREQVQWRATEEKKRVVIFLRFDCSQAIFGSYLFRYENRLPLWEFGYSFWQTQKCMREMRAEYISNRMKAAALLIVLVNKTVCDLQHITK